jgi:hypothetical protein
MIDQPSVRTVEVFVPGGMPTVTYVPRESNVEEKVRDYVAERHKLLSVSGPSKCGKTVLLHSVLDGGLWIAGGDIRSLEDFWAAIADELGLYPEEQETEGSADGEATSRRFKAGAAPFRIGLEGERTSSTQFGRTYGRSRSRTRPLRALCKEALEDTRAVMVLDDFHYIDRSIQQEISRALKDLIFRGVGAIVASVPHRADDPIRVEREMTGRVEQLRILPWRVPELLSIAREGFKALNVEDSSRLAERLAEESFGSPFLMQDFCLQLCKLNGIRTSVGIASRLSAPPDWQHFFQQRATTASRNAFDLLARGPRQRKDRRHRVLKNGSVTDIYGVVLAAIACTGPLTSITYEQLRQALRWVLLEELPQRHEVTRVLEEMSRIARERVEGEPVVDYDAELGVLHVADPFFAYFLRWGSALRWGEDQISQVFPRWVPPRLPPA